MSSSVELFSLISREVTLSGMLVVITEEDDDSPADVGSESEDNVVTLSSRRGSTEVTLSTATVEA